MIQDYRNIPCPRCGAATVFHAGKNGKSDFLGCSQYGKTHCRGLINLSVFSGTSTQVIKSTSATEHSTTVTITRTTTTKTASVVSTQVEHESLFGLLEDDPLDNYIRTCGQNLALSSALLVWRKD